MNFEVSKQVKELSTITVIFQFTTSHRTSRHWKCTYHRTSGKSTYILHTLGCARVDKNPRMLMRKQRFSATVKVTVSEEPPEALAYCTRLLYSYRPSLVGNSLTFRCTLRRQSPVFRWWSCRRRPGRCSGSTVQPAGRSSRTSGSPRCPGGGEDTDVRLIVSKYVLLAPPVLPFP